MEVNKIYNINFLDNTLPDKCANLIIADPPYFEVKGDFDFVWDSFEHYLQDVEKWCLECKRILADNGTLFWYGDAKNIAYAQIIFDKHFNLLNSLVWENTNDHKQQIRFNPELRTFAPCTERILMYGNKTETYHTELGLQNNDLNNYTKIRNWIKSEREKIPHSLIYLNKHIFGYDNGKDGVAGNKLSPFKANWQFPDEVNYNKIKEWCFKNNYDAFQKPYKELRKEYEELRKEYEELRRPFNNERFYGDVIRLPNYDTKKYDHDTVKPETLTRELILTCSRPNDLVVVPFAGSGTECAMAVKEGRRTIGFEITEKHAKMSNDRVQNILRQPSLFVGS
jgi:DNA modification methylase